MKRHFHNGETNPRRTNEGLQGLEDRELLSNGWANKMDVRRPFGGKRVLELVHVNSLQRGADRAVGLDHDPASGMQEPELQVNTHQPERCARFSASGKNVRIVVLE